VLPFKIIAAIADLEMDGVTDVDVEVRRAAGAYSTSNLAILATEVARMADPTAAVTVVKV